MNNRRSWNQGESVADEASNLVCMRQKCRLIKRCGAPHPAQTTCIGNNFIEMINA